MERHALTELQWQRIRPLLPPNGRRGQQWEDHRRVINGILWILRTGVPWRDLPDRFGKWSTVYERFRRWTRDGFFDRLLEQLQTKAQLQGRLDWSIAMIDGSVVRAHRVAAGAKKNFGAAGRAQRPRPRAQSRRVSTKIHLICDGRGLPLAIGLTGGQGHEIKMLKPMVDAVRVTRGVGRPRQRPDALAGDKAYSAGWSRRWLNHRRIRPVIPTRRNEAQEKGFDHATYRRRNVIERCIGWLKEARRVAARYEKLAVHYEAMIKLAMALRYLRR